MRPPSLAAWQGRLKRYLITGEDDPELQRWLAGSPDEAVLRLEVYRNAYYIRLEEALARDYPVLRAVLGDAAFGREMARYLRARPSASPTLRHVGQALPAHFEAHRRLPVADLCRIERAVLEAFDAADVAPLGAEALHGLPPEAWQGLRFSLHPSVSLLQVASNALDVWKAFRQKRRMPELAPGTARSLVVWRSPRGPAATAVSSEHRFFLERIAAGEPFASICEALWLRDDRREVPEVAACYLAQSIRNGWLTRMRTGR